jgi:uncharacterized protein
MDKYQQNSPFLGVLLGLLLLLPVTAVQAAAENLFESEVVVSNQSPGVRTHAMKTALQEVLVRVAGQDAVLTTEAAKAMLKNPAQRVQQYRYFTVSGSEPPVLKLWVRFDGEAIRQALQQQGVTYWGAERPDTLVWLAVEDRGKRYVVAADDGTDVYHQIERAARQRGVPVLFPLLDLEDQSQVQFSDIWGGFFDNVMEASKRYNPQAVLIGRLNRSPSGGWSSRWHLAVAGSPSSWTDSRQQLDTLAQQGIADTADILASRFAVSQAGGNLETVTVSIKGVNTLADYARLSEYLAGLTAVVDVQVAKVAGTEIQYALQLNGSLQDLIHTVTIGTVLEPLASATLGSFRLRQ